MFELMAGIIVALSALGTSVHIVLYKHERRLTRIETKVDLFLKNNGIDPTDCGREKK